MSTVVRESSSLNRFSLEMSVEIVIHPPPIPFEFYSQDFHFPLFNWIEIDSWFSQDENYENIVYNSYYQVKIYNNKTFSFFTKRTLLLSVGAPLPHIFGVLLLHASLCLAQNGGWTYEAV